MNILKVSTLSAISNIIKLFLSFALNKFLSIYLGPSGISIVGQFQNFINIISTFANGGIYTGVIKYVSEYENDKEKKQVIGSSLIITFISTLIISLSIFLYSDYISTLIMSSLKYSYIFTIFSITLIFFSLNNLIIGILNGYNKIKKLVLINIISSIVSSFYSFFLVYYYNLDGALIAYATSQSIIFIISLISVFKKNFFQISFIDFFNKSKFLNLLKYSFMTLISVLCVNLSQMYVRKFISSYLGLEEAGYWQSMLKLSDMYLIFITMTLTTYYLPKLSAAKSDLEIKKELIIVAKLFLPILAIINMIIYLFRFYIINIIFSYKFMPMSDLFAFQMLGDFLKISSWLLSFIMTARAMTKTFVITEILFSFYYVLVLILCVNRFGFIGISYAWFIEYLTYTLVMIYLFRNILFKKLLQ